ncbi:MAG: spermidine synthase [Propionibacteriaceae bacterium]
MASARFEELDWRPTPIGEISLRRRREPTLDVDVYEVRLGAEFLMSSLFTVAEEELATLGLAALGDAAPIGGGFDVVVGGLGLGYTARTALADPRVGSLWVVETLEAVIGWHRDLLLPGATALTRDPRCHLAQADFFAAVAGSGLGPATLGDASGTTAPSRWHAILLDVDHAPDQVLHPSHAEFYSAAGLRRLAGTLHPGGVFALWSDKAPDEAFVAVLAQVFGTAVAHVVSFANFYTGGTSANTVYIAHQAASPAF